MKRFDNFEKANARQWDEVSTTSYTPSIAELDTPEDDNEFLLINLNDSPTRLQPAPTAPSNASQAPLSYQHTARGGLIRAGQGQYDVQGQRANTSSRGRGGSYAHQVNAARHPQNTGGRRSRFTPPSQAGSQANGPNYSRAPSAPTESHRTPPAGYHQNVNRNNHGNRYRISDESPSGIGRREHHNEKLSKFNVYGEWSPKKGVWPKSDGLTTTRRAIDQSIKKQMQNERERFLRDPAEEDRILAYGFYLWPQEDDSVVEVLGIDLAPLRHIRMNQKVYIQCVQEEGLAELLKISSESANAETHIAEAIRGIRSVIADARARAVLATPKYFVFPPTASAMRAFIGPKEIITETAVVDGVEKTKNVKCIGTQLVGQNLSEKEQKMWIQKTLNLNNYIGDFQDQLSSSLMELAPLKYEMRMRLNFGHVAFKRFDPRYASSEMSIDEFADMLGHHLIRAEIEKTMPAMVVLRMGMKITDLLDVFRPAEGRSLSLKHVDFKHTEIFYVSTRRGDNFRVEANIDTRYDDDYSPEYQLGTYNVYREDYKNKRIDLATVDPERHFDHTLQVITDHPVDIPTTSEKEFESLVEGSISTKPKDWRTDQFMLQYPRLHPRNNTELQINKLVMRSASQYAFQSSGYVVEITLDRTWDGPDTRSDPRMVASVSLFHPQWDWEMESMEYSTQERKWKSDLSNFFENGFEDFFAAIQFVQDLLGNAAGEAEEEAAKAQAAREAVSQAEIEAILEAEREAALEAETEAALEAERQEAADAKRQTETASARSLLDD